MCVTLHILPNHMLVPLLNKICVTEKKFLAQEKNALLQASVRLCVSRIAYRQYSHR